MKGLFMFFCLLFTCHAFSQADSVYNQMKPDSVIEKLVNMAYENARVHALENSATASDYVYRRGKTAWLNNIVIAANVNEFSLSQGSSSDPLKQSTQYPRYNIGLVLPVGLFINNGKQNKSNYYNYESMLNQINIEKQDIRREVQTAYENYLLNKQLLILQDEALTDAELLKKSQEDKFRNQEITIEAYLTVSRAYNAERVKKVNIQHELVIISAQLEALIGMKIEDALRQMSAEGIRR